MIGTGIKIAASVLVVVLTIMFGLDILVWLWEHPFAGGPALVVVMIFGPIFATPREW